jgi:hypothetical protein
MALGSMEGCMKSAQLTCVVRDGVLTITIGVDTLAHAALLGPAQEYDEAIATTRPAWRVTDPEGFAKDMVVALLDEDEEGHSVLTKLLDAAAQVAAESGSDAVVPAECTCNPADNTGGGHLGTCPAFEPECTCYEVTGGHQPGCYFNRARPPAAVPYVGDGEFASPAEAAAAGRRLGEQIKRATGGDVLRAFQGGDAIPEPRKETPEVRVAAPPFDDWRWVPWRTP